MQPTRPGRSGAPRSSHHVVAFALLGAAAVLAGSCRETLVGDRVDVATEMCTLLQDCYGSEYRCETVEAQLREASPEARAAFLNAFTAEACLGSCPGARACLDVEPFCQAQGGCEYDHECCNWSKGEAACGESTGQCCKPNGIPCVDGDLCCDSTCREGTCGGYTCQQIDESCDEDIDCCSLYCANGTCSVIDCVPPGGECQTVTDCCLLSDEPTEPGPTVACDGNRCVPIDSMECTPTGGQCSSSEQCCPDLQEQCLFVVEVTAFACGPQVCEPGSPCTVEGTCCPGFACDQGANLCLPDVACVELGDSCGALDVCCSGGCNAGICTETTCGSGIAPPEWQCQPVYYNDCTWCDCSCGAHDPDCDTEGLPVYCEDAARPSPEGTVCDELDICILP